MMNYNRTRNTDSRSAPHSPSSALSAACPAVIAAVAGALAFYRVWAPMPWADELQTLGYCLASWRDGLYLATHSQNMPVAYWLIAKVCLTLTGVTFTTMRVVSGVAFVGFAWLATRLLMRWLPGPAGVVAALLIVLHPALVWHARDGRVYSLLLLAETTSLALLVAPPFRGRLALWAVISAAAVYLHHHAVFFLVLQAVFILDRRMDARRWLPLVGLLVLPDLLLVYWGMRSPNVASQMFGAGQTFGPNVQMALDRIGAGTPEYVYGPLSSGWRQALGGGLLVVAAVITLLRGTSRTSWMGLAIIGLIVVPAAAHDALDVFYEPRFILCAVPLALAWLVGTLAMVWRTALVWPVAAGLIGLFAVTDYDVLTPHVLPYRPARADINEALERMPGDIVMHPGYLVGCWPVPPGFDRQGRVVLSDTGSMVGVEKTMAAGNARLYSPDMPWSRFRRDVVRNGPFTLIQGAPPLYPRQHEDFCRRDEPWETGYRLRRLWPEHPFVAIWRFEPVTPASRP
jgi:hypothetical protein